MEHPIHRLAHAFSSGRSHLGKSGSASPPARNRFRAFMCIEAAAFFIAATVHSGGAMAGAQASAVAQAIETVLGSVLGFGALASWIAPDHARSIGLLAQAIAFFGATLGLLLIAIGVGPRSLPDLVFYGGVLLLLSLGWIIVSRWRRD